MEQPPPSSPQQSDPTVSEVRTRSGRVSKPPTRYEPVEQVEDDYSAEDYDSGEEPYDVDTDGESDDYEDDDDEDEDADEDGNLKGFVVPDKSESDSDSNGGEDTPPVSVVKKRRP